MLDSSGEIVFLSPGVEVIGVQSSRYPAMLQALRGQPIMCGKSTIAEGIAVKQPGKITRQIISALVAELLLVEEDDIERAVLTLLEIEKTVVEGAGGAGLAALFRHRERFAGRKVGLILCGGNIDYPLIVPLSCILWRSEPGFSRRDKGNAQARLC